MKRFLFFALALLATLPAFSQARNASITGLIADTSGARLPGATVTAVDTQSNLVHHATSDEHGEYTLVELPPGNYKVVAIGKGFQREERIDVVLDVAQAARIDFTLKAGEAQTVNVDAAPPLLESQSSEISNVIDNRKVNDLPLNGRQFYSLALLSPAALPPAQTSTNGFRGGFNVAGQPEVANNFFVNGIIDVDEIANYPAFRPSVETIQEFKLQTGTYAAEYGLRNGGQVEIVTKAGGNDFHGDLFEFIRNQVTDAKAYFNTSGRPTPLKQNQFGGTLGGPIWRDHTFFFFGYEGIRLRQGVGAVRTTVPTGALDTYNMHNGDFRQLLTLATPKHIYIPGTTTDFATPNVIPESYISPLGQQLLNWAFPQPLYTTAAGSQPSNNYFNQDVSRESGNEGSIRIDHRLSSSDQLFLNYNLFNDPTYMAYSGQCGSSVLPGFGCDQTTVSQLGALGETHTFGSSVVNEFRLGFNRYHQKRSVDPAQFLLRNALNSNGLVPAAGGAGLTLSLSTSNWGATAFGMVPNNRYDTAKQVSDSITWLKGAHTFKAGYTIISNLAVYVHDIQGAGTLSFVPGTGPTTGYDLADLLTGTVATSSYSALSIAATTHPTITNHLFYAQDDWKVLPTLTLNYGLRYELATPMHENDGFGSVFDPRLAAGASTIAGGFRVTNGRDGNSKYPYHMDKNNFAPRVGLSWRVLNNDKTVLRAAYGIYFYSTPTLTTGLSGWERQTPFTVAASSYTSTAAVPLTIASPTHPTANPFDPADLSAAVTNTSAPKQTTGLGFDPRFATPYINQYSFGLQQALTRRLSLDVSYLGSTGNKLLNILDYNQALPSATNSYAQANATRPLPAWGKISWAQSALKASYNALLVKLQQSYGNGLSFTAAYTYAKAIDNGAGIISTGDSSSATPQDSRNLRAEKGPSDFDIKHRFVFSPVYDLPFGRGKTHLNQGFLAPVVGGWKISGIFQAQSGTPFTITNGSTVVNGVQENNQSHTYESGTTTSNDRPNWVSNPNKNAPHTPSHWFNPAAFALNTPGTFGTEKRNAVRGPHFTNLDVAVVRDFSVWRETIFQFRVEAFNVANHPNFYNPAGTATKYDPTNLGSFGSISNTYAPRQLQFALKYLF
ncbi:MAG: TonB-dependent receptor [Acidobacteriaceae bacterium]|nr:TonB-dependent receptor [Acidobacteriaceae bacterium]